MLSPPQHCYFSNIKLRQIFPILITFKEASFKDESIQLHSHYNERYMGT